MGMWNNIKTFQSYQFRQINPDTYYCLWYTLQHISWVSIVSIQADQSRHVSELELRARISWFQSYQFRQINPDNGKCRWQVAQLGCFNRINSGRSIPTSVKRIHKFHNIDVSIVSIQADQSRRYPRSVGWRRGHKKFQSYQFRQINPDLPTGEWLYKDNYGFQSYQFRQINPDWLFLQYRYSTNGVSIVSIQADQSRP